MSYVFNYQCVKRKVITCGIEKYGKIPAEKLSEFRKKTLLQYYTRPSYIIKKLSKINSLPVFMNYVKLKKSYGDRKEINYIIVMKYKTLEYMICDY